MHSISALLACCLGSYSIPLPKFGLWMLITRFPLLFVVLLCQVVLLFFLFLGLFLGRADPSVEWA